ncbi:hypothetical protein LWI28_011463 [Acer negundo]|uniref:Uncharacterized protein n=1 Tax=Acer negundo TaxID=4023 RepID=A0AAD5JPZ6_ACENE|nr:hypothetical protein LWI28_011463 [Acer negundo]
MIRIRTEIFIQVGLAIFLTEPFRPSPLSTRKSNEIYLDFKSTSIIDTAKSGPPGLDLLGHAAFWFFIASLPTSFVLSIDKLRFFLLSRNVVRWRPSSSLADSSKTKARKIKHFDEEQDNFITSGYVLTWNNVTSGAGSFGLIKAFVFLLIFNTNVQYLLSISPRDVSTQSGSSPVCAEVEVVEY